MYAESASLRPSASSTPGPAPSSSSASTCNTFSPNGRTASSNYWLREGRSNNAEVDYVAEFGGHVVPIEVKAGRAGALKSLHQFVAEKRVGLAVRFDASPPSLQTVDTRVRRGGGSERVRYPLLSLPLYLVERLPRILDGLEAVS